MKKKIILSGIFLLILTLTTLFLSRNYIVQNISHANFSLANIIPRKEKIGFLPYWLIGKTQKDYSKYITKLTYFSLSMNTDGSIQKYTHPGESEPGYLALQSGKVDEYLNAAKAAGEDTAITVFSGNEDTISEFLKDPVSSANTLTTDVIPLMQKYGFSDLNLDIEQVSDASQAARMKFTEFVKTVKENLDRTKIGSLSIDISGLAFVKNLNLADPAALVPFTDKIILMAYDYHTSSSFVTGPVAPGFGAGSISEFDTNAAVLAALKIMPEKKLILGVPLYGYEWETIGNVPRSAIIPHTGLIVSNLRAETFLNTCATCSAEFDEIDKESHVIYKDTESGSYHQIFFPDAKSTQFKVDLAKQNSLGGVALWALGYEGATILEPLSGYHY